MLTITSSRSAVGALLVAALLLPSGCGGSDADPSVAALNPRTITKDAFAAMGQLDTVRMTGTLKSADGQVAIDTRSDSDGNCTGSLELASGRLQFIHTADGTWLKGDRAYWFGFFGSAKDTDRALKHLGTSWAILAKDPVDFDAYCEVAPMLDGFTAFKDGGVGRLSKGAVEVIGDVEALPVSLKGNGKASKIWVSLDTPTRVLKIASKEQPAPLTMTFAEFDVSVDAEAPPADEVVDMAAYTVGVKNESAQKKG